MLGIPGVFQFFQRPPQIVNLMQFGNRSNIEDVKAGKVGRQGGWTYVGHGWFTWFTLKKKTTTRISIETVSFSQFQWVYNEKRNEQNVWQQSKRWKWCWKDLRKLQVSFQDTSMNVVTCIGVQHQAVAEAQKVQMGKWGLTIAFRDNVGKTTINHPLGNGKHTTYLWWFRGWLMTLFYPHYSMLISTLCQEKVYYKGLVTAVKAKTATYLFRRWPQIMW